MNTELEVIESQVPATIAALGDAEVDIQVTTARRYPRSITVFVQRAQEMATLSPDIAASCIYALPRKEHGKVKNIEGPSARFAEICASAWGNLRAEGKVLAHDEEFVTSRGTAWDVQNNVAIAYEVRRRITSSDGRRYSGDMIAVTGNAGASIALRNAILKVIPTSFWKPIYLACRKVVAGDARTFASRRDNMLHEFAVMGVPEERLCAAIDVKGKADITLEHMATLAGFYTALKDGEITIEEAFPEGGGLGAPQPAQRKSQQQPPTSTTTPAPSQAETARREDGQGNQSQARANGGNGETPTPAPVSNKSIGLITSVSTRGDVWIIELDTAFRCATKQKEFAAAAIALCDAKRRVELVTVSRGQKNFPVLQEIIPVEASAS